MTKTVLIVGYVWPEPNSSAAGSRMLQLINLFLAKNCKVIFASAATLSEHRFDLQTLGVAEKSIALNCSSFDTFVADLKPDIVLFDRFFTEEQFGWRVEQVCPGALRILDTEDLHSLRHIRHQLLRTAQKQYHSEQERYSVPPVVAEPIELYKLMSVDDMAQREVASIFRCDLSLIISEFEVALLRDHFNIPESLLCYCPLWVDSSAPIRPSPDFAQRQHFVVIGNFRHEPNWDAVLWLKHELWPQIHAKLSDTELHIYGAYPPPKVTQLHNPKQGFYVKGWAENAWSVISNARVCLAPLRFGAGIKGKLIDAMNAGTPNVTTSIGAEAMYSDQNWSGAIADTSASFVQAAVNLYEDPVAWHRAQEQGFTILRNYFGAFDFAELLWIRLDKIYAHLAAERQQNFVGAVLRNQYNQSLRYKSQWIEAKNRN